MTILYNGLLICAYLLLFLIKQSSKFVIADVKLFYFACHILQLSAYVSAFLFLALACQCAAQDNYSPPTPLTSTAHGAGGQSTTCSYDLGGVHYYCVYDVSARTTENNIICIFIFF